MVDVKLTDLTAKGAAMAVTDIVEITEDPSGTPITKSVTGAEIVSMVSTEGTWTPTVTFSTGSGTVTYNIQQGKWTKIGNFIHITGRIRTTSIASRTGTVSISSLPFTAGATYFHVVSFALTLALNITPGESLTGYVNPSTTDINLQLWELAAGTTSLTFDEWTDGGSVCFSAAYTV